MVDGAVQRNFLRIYVMFLCQKVGPANYETGKGHQAFDFTLRTVAPTGLAEPLQQTELKFTVFSRFFGLINNSEKHSLGCAR